jgi:hypothetical protein
MNCSSSRSVQLELPPSWKLETSRKDKEIETSLLFFFFFGTKEDTMEDRTGDRERCEQRNKEGHKKKGYKGKRKKKGDA